MAKSVKTSPNKNLKSKFRFVVLNDTTFEEKFSLILTRTNVWIFLSTIAVSLIFFTAAAIIYTPVKYFIPGFGDYRYKSQMVRMQFHIDSMERKMQARQLWLENLNNVISGNIDTSKPQMNKDASIDKSKIKLDQASDVEDDLRKEVEEEQSFSLSLSATKNPEAVNEVREMHPIAPVLGVVTQEYNPQIEHFGIDIVAEKDAPIKSAIDGKVISTSWTLETGYVVTVQHRNSLLSIYKHCERILKKTGSFVSAGEVIAIVGNTGEETTGPHLHFELWHDGEALNPRDFIGFDKTTTTP